MTLFSPGTRLLPLPTFYSPQIFAFATAALAKNARIFCTLVPYCRAGEALVIFGGRPHSAIAGRMSQPQDQRGKDLDRRIKSTVDHVVYMVPSHFGAARVGAHCG